MDSKMQRYMQRIERLISTPNRASSPMRPSKSPLSCRTNNLDRYLKYELSAKMITGVIDHRHQALKVHLFNALRQAHPARHTDTRVDERMIEWNGRRIAACWPYLCVFRWM